MTSEDLLGELGGLFHIFMGMSLMSFVEIVECFVLIFYFLLIAKSTSRRMDIVNSDWICVHFKRDQKVFLTLVQPSSFFLHSDDHGGLFLTPRFCGRFVPYNLC